ncbi:MAG: hypothetical protein HQ582_28935 [Planctomycetes bacterium]|nr:hypothetical protein [Planctomycetota bacterium]
MIRSWCQTELAPYVTHVNDASSVGIVNSSIDALPDVDAIHHVFPGGVFWERVN